MAKSKLKYSNKKRAIIMGKNKMSLKESIRILEDEDEWYIPRETKLAIVDTLLRDMDPNDPVYPEIEEKSLLLV